MNCAFVISHTLIHDQIFQESETMGVITVRRLMLMTMMFIVLVPDVVQGDPPAAAGNYVMGGGCGLLVLYTQSAQFIQILNLIYTDVVQKR